MARAVLVCASRLLAPRLAEATDPVHGHNLVIYVAFAFTLGSVAASYLAAAYYLRIPAFRQLLSKVRARVGTAWSVQPERPTSGILVGRTPSGRGLRERA